MLKQLILIRPSPLSLTRRHQFFQLCLIFCLKLIFLLSRITRTSICWDFQPTTKTIHADMKRIFSTNIPNLHNFIPWYNVIVDKAYCTEIFCDYLPPVYGNIQRIVVLGLCIIATSEVPNSKKAFNWHLVPTNISAVSPRTQLFHFSCGWPSLLTNVFVRLYSPRCSTVIPGNNCSDLCLVKIEISVYLSPQ